mmetsp:Transcript_22107/g.63325  ORF Transcript_22107/g.63325 Transcript_22107/m.63325 type:complete len:234 (+) Transcript_22107:89-790(+)
MSELDAIDDEDTALLAVERPVAPRTPRRRGSSWASRGGTALVLAALAAAVIVSGPSVGSKHRRAARATPDVSGGQFLGAATGSLNFVTLGEEAPVGKAVLVTRSYDASADKKEGNATDATVSVEAGEWVFQVVDGSEDPGDDKNGGWTFIYTDSKKGWVPTWAVAPLKDDSHNEVASLRKDAPHREHRGKKEEHDKKEDHSKKEGHSKEQVHSKEEDSSKQEKSHEAEAKSTA